MKQKTIADNSPVTKKTVREALEDYPTKKDMEDAFKKSANQLEQVFDKKIADRLTANQNAFRAEIKYEFSLMREEFDVRFTKFTNLILAAIDPLIQDTKTRQQEREIIAAQISETRDRIDNHEKRIVKLEQI